jgi:hypothetical protein
MSEPTASSPAPSNGQRPGFIRRILTTMDTTTKVVLAVSGLIAALTALWATATAVIPHGKPSTDAAGQSPSAATAATSPYPGAQAEAAAKVESCEAQHKMSKATQPVDNGAGTREFETCEWPPSNLADADGFWEIRVISDQGPGSDEASGMDDADRISGPCQKFSMTYDYRHMGGVDHLRPFTVDRGAIFITTNDGGEIWTGDQATLPFNQDRNEAVVLTSGNYLLDGVACAR